MFSNLVRSSLLAIALSAISASAAGSLNVKVDGPTAVKDVNDLKFTSTITNTGNEAMTLVNDPSGLLSSKYFTEKYDVVHTSGTGPAFNGVRVKYSPKGAVDHGDVTTLAPGQSITVDHDLSKTYDFTTPGEGLYSFEPKNVFYVVDPTTKQINVVQANEVPKVAVHLSGKLVVTATTTTHRKRDISFKNCNDVQQSQIVQAAPAAVDYVYESSSYLSGITDGTPRFTTWFGSYTTDRKNLVQSHYDSIGDFPLNVAYDCSCTDPGVFAYVYPNDPSTIYLCGAFWNAPTTGTDSQAGTIVHESTHFTIHGGTKDLAYGQDACKQLAINNPDNAVMNADSHEYFAENNPPLP